MKRSIRILFFLLSLFMMSQTVFADATVTFLNESKDLSVSVSGESAKKRVSVLVYRIPSRDASYADMDIEAMKNCFYTVKQFKTDENGALTVNLGLPSVSGSLSGELFKVMVGGEVESCTICYNATDEEIKTIKKEFSDATADEIGGLLESYSTYNAEAKKPILYVDVTDENYLNNKSAFCNAFVSVRESNCPEGFQTIFEIEETTNVAIALTMLNKAVDKSVFMEKYNDIWGLDLENQNYTDHKQEICRLMYLQSEVKDGKISSVSDVKNAYKKALVVFEFNQSTREGVGRLLKQNPELFADLDYKNVSESEVHKALWNVKFTTPEDIVSAFEKAVSELSNVKPSGGSKGGSNGGNGIGGGFYNTKTAAETISVPNGQTQEKSFDDLNGYEWAEKAITTLYDKNVISGCGDRSFEPARPVLREEFVKMVVGAFSIVAEAPAINFSDVFAQKWYYPYICTGVGSGLVNGKGDNSFGIGETLTREDAACIIYRAISYTGKAETGKGTSDFRDFDKISHYAVESINQLVSMGVISGRDDNSFAPQDHITRAEAAMMIYNAIMR